MLREPGPSEVWPCSPELAGSESHLEFKGWGGGLLIKHALQLKWDRCIINAWSQCGAMRISPCASRGLTKEREEKRRGGGGVERKQERQREPARKRKREGKPRRRLAFLFSFFSFLDVFAFTTPKFSLIPSVHNRAIHGEKKRFHMCKFASSLP